MAVSVFIRRPRVYVTILPHTRFGGAGAIPITPDVLQPAIVDVTTTRHFGDAGGFQITLNLNQPPLSYTTFALGAPVTTWRDLIMPMDAVQIEMEVETAQGMRRETVMRGFIDYVGMAASYGGEGPDRTIVIAGRDYHRVLLSRIYFADGGAPTKLEIIKRMEEGVHLLQQHFKTIDPERPQDTAMAEPGIDALTVMSVLYNYFFVPTFQTVAGNFPEVPGFRVAVPTFYPDASTGDNFDSDLFTFDPAFTPTNSEPLVVLKEIVDAYSHAPWRELFFDDYQEAAGVTTSYFVWRPTPWLGIGGYPFQFTPFQMAAYKTYNNGMAWKITADELIEMNVGFDDTQVINLISTYASIYSNWTEAAKVLASGLESFALDDNTNPAIIGNTDPFDYSSYQLYTWQPYDFRTSYFDINGAFDENHQAVQIPLIQKVAARWNQRLVAAYAFNEMMDSGTCVIRGDPRIHMGHYVGIEEPGYRLPTLSPSSEKFALYYVEGVQHIMKYPRDMSSSQGSYMTILSLTRGRSRLSPRMPLEFTNP